MLLYFLQWENKMAVALTKRSEKSQLKILGVMGRVKEEYSATNCPWDAFEHGI